MVQLVKCFLTIMRTQVLIPKTHGKATSRGTMCSEEAQTGRSQELTDQLALAELAPSLLRDPVSKRK